MQSIPKNGTSFAGRSRLAEALASVHITDVYTALTGVQPKKGRGPATWRDGTGQNVSFSDLQNVWYDHAANEGGGIVDLVMRARGCNKQEAAKWLADYAGVPLEDLPAPPENLMRQRARERRLRDRDLPLAKMWREAAISMAEQVLHELKSRILQPDMPDAPCSMLGHSCDISVEDLAEIRHLESKIEHWRCAGDWVLVDEYRKFLQTDPTLTSGILRAVWRRWEAKVEQYRRAFLGEIV